MPKHKKHLVFKLPFKKQIKIKKDLFSNLIGLGIFAFSVILSISFFKTGNILTLFNEILTDYFGALALCIPIILLLFSSHFFNSQKLKLIRPHVTVGLVLIFIALLGAIRAGSIGELLGRNLSSDFSSVGAFFILLITFVVGIILFFNTSLDVFLLMVIGAGKAFVLFIYTGIIQPFVNRTQAGKAPERQVPKKGEFISSQQSGPVINTPPPQPVPAKQQAGSGELTIRSVPGSVAKDWAYPPVTLLEKVQEQKPDIGDVATNSDTIEKTLDSFGIKARVSEINPGPTVTQYALEIVMGTKLSKITSLGNDLALALAAPTGQVRIEAPIPGRSLVGIEIPNRRSEIVSLVRMLQDPEMAQDPHPLTVPLGLDVSGKTVITNLGKMPHSLVAGTTGSGKSVLLNAWICNFLFRTTPDDLRLILVDPKRVEFTSYNGIPHLLTEVIVDPEKIIAALKWTVNEMNNRYKLFSQVHARNLESYNSKEGVEKLPYIVFIVDELSDLMMVAAREAEEYITRIAQMARATGIHLVLATQRPSVNVITGLMKANIPTRIAFNVASLIDSRVVLDMPGAEKLVGRGDMLYMPADQAKPRRIQGPYLSEKDVQNVVGFLRQRVPEVHYTEEVTEQDTSTTTSTYSGMRAPAGSKDEPLLRQAIDLIYQEGKASATLIQRRLAVGYSRAARILDELEKEGYIGPAHGSKPREIIQRPSVQGSPAQTPEQLHDQQMKDELGGIH